MNFYYEGHVLWSQIDANQHMRHSAYADFAAQVRLNMLEKVGLNPASLLKRKIGPVLFREELIYLREVVLNDTVSVTAELSKSRSDGSRWSIRHEMYRGDGVKVAVINVDGAWIDMEKRKLCLLPDNLALSFMHADKTADYSEEEKKV